MRRLNFHTLNVIIFLYDQKMHFRLLSKLQLLFYASFDLNDGKCTMVGIGGRPRLEVAVSPGSFTGCELLIHEFTH